MSALSISPPFPIFTDIDGQPLENGYIWIGTANLNPITNPINVYWDAALTVAAVQPIRTLAGYPSNSGTPARLYVNSDYSIQVQNRNGSMVYSAPVDTEFMSSANISYLPAGTGAVATTVQAKLRESVSVFGFMTAAQVADVQSGTASIDVTSAIQAAITDVGSSGSAVFFPAGTYLISGIYMNYTGQRLVGDGKYRTVLKMKAGSTYGIASKAFGVRADATAVTYTIGYSIEEMSVDLTLASNLTTVAAIAIEDSYDCSVKEVNIIDPLDELSNRWGLWLGRAIYTTSTYQCVIGRVLHKGNANAGLNNFGTTVAHYSLSAWHAEHYYYQDMLYVMPVFQKDVDKFVLGPAVGPFVLIGGDFEQGGYLFKSTTDGGAANISGYGCAISPMYGNLFGGVTQTPTGTARPGNTILDFECQDRAPRAIASASRSGTTVTVDLVLTAASGQFKYMAPAVGEIITVAGTGTAMDGTGLIVASSTMTYPTVNRITYQTNTSGALGPITTGTVKPDPGINYRYTRMFGNNFGWDPLAARLLARQRIVLNNQAYLTGFKADGTTEVPLIGVDASGRLSMTDGSTYQYIDDGGNFRNTKAGKGFTVTSPDGLVTKTITINNAGAITLI